MTLSQTADLTKNPAYDVGYAVGYFVGEYSNEILFIAGLLLGSLTFLLLRRRKKRLERIK